MPLADPYQIAVDDLTPSQKLARVHALFDWVRDLYARQLSQQLGNVSTERLRWEVALRLYGNDPQARKLIERKLRDVQS